MTFTTLPDEQCTTLMVQGTTSDAGKTTLVAAICRILARQNIKVAPLNLKTWHLIVQ